MKKRMFIMLICVGILFGVIFGYKLFISLMMKRYMAANVSPAVTVSAMPVGYSLWQPKLRASGSSRALKGVSVTTELAGMVQTIYFTPGAFVEAGTVLVQLNADSDVALLHSLQASADLAKTVYTRDKAQFAVKAVSQATLDADAANLKSADAQVEQQAATVAKKTIRAPFSGRLGISAVNPGQYINPGDKVVTLQTLDPIYVDFFVPQQMLAQLQTGLPVNITTDTFIGQTYTGKITTIDPLVDRTTRNVEVEATIMNPKSELTPGMFVSVEVDVGTEQKYLTLPQTAISFNPYGQLVYVVMQSGADKIVKQAFVKTGETRGDQVTILEGLKEGDMIVTSGQLKLKNGSKVIINNSIVPPNNPAPKLPNEH